MSRRSWKCEHCGVRSTLLPDAHRCMTQDVLRYRELKRQQRAQKRMEWTPEMEELADYAKKSAASRVRNFIDEVLGRLDNLGGDE